MALYMLSSAEVSCAATPDDALSQRRDSVLLNTNNNEIREAIRIFVREDAGRFVIADLWLQEEMVRLGMARVYTWPDTIQDSQKLYRAEQEARAGGRGIWSNSFYNIRGPEPNMLAQDVDSFQIVEGIITSAADIRGRVYLNFGADYKTDFTIAIAKRDLSLIHI